MTIRYGITEEVYTLQEEQRISYGIAAYADAEEDGTAIIVASVHDITTDKVRLSEFILKCNRCGLSPLHLTDAVDDFLSE